MARFEAYYYPGETNERLPEWRVVEWTVINQDTGAKCGNCIWKTYDMVNGEQQAIEIAAAKQHEYNLEFAKDFA